jgi:hypothetical protein
MQWLASYSDGSQLMQWEGGKENKYVNIDRNKLSSFAILGDSGELILSVQFERPTQKLICRRRQAISVTGIPLSTVWLVGWHENINGTSVKAICYIYEDGHIEMAGAKDDVQLIPEEK